MKALAAERAVQREAESADVAGLPPLGCSVGSQVLSDPFSSPAHVGYHHCEHHPHCIASF